MYTQQVHAHLVSSGLTRAALVLLEDAAIDPLPAVHAGPSRAHRTIKGVVAEEDTSGPLGPVGQVRSTPRA